MSPLTPELPPATICELIVIAPSDTAVHPAPSAPLARLKLSDAVPVPVPPLAAQATATLVTLAPAIAPVPPVTVQVWPDGWVSTVTAYAAPDVSLAGKVKEP